MRSRCVTCQITFVPIPDWLLFYFLKCFCNHFLKELVSSNEVRVWGGECQLCQVQTGPAFGSLRLHVCPTSCSIYQNSCFCNAGLLSLSIFSIFFFIHYLFMYCWSVVGLWLLGIPKSTWCWPAGGHCSHKVWYSSASPSRHLHRLLVQFVFLFPWCLLPSRFQPNPLHSH
jgi:hypothetical protein